MICQPQSRVLSESRLILRVMTGRIHSKRASQVHSDSRAVAQ